MEDKDAIEQLKDLSDAAEPRFISIVWDDEGIPDLTVSGMNIAETIGQLRALTIGLETDLSEGWRAGD